MPAATSYVVTAGVAIAKTDDGSEVYVYRGAPLPKSVSAKERDRLVDAGLVGKQTSKSDTSIKDSASSSPDSGSGQGSTPQAGGATGAPPKS